MNIHTFKEGFIFACVGGGGYALAYGSTQEFVQELFSSVIKYLTVDSRTIIYLMEMVQLLTTEPLTLRIVHLVLGRWQFAWPSMAF